MSWTSDAQFGDHNIEKVKLDRKELKLKLKTIHHENVEINITIDSSNF